jgi:DNA-binding transcriptional ArsR family regulator
MLLYYNMYGDPSMPLSDRQDRVFRALADPTRRRVLDLLRDRAMTTGQICDELSELDRCTTMQHLGVLENAELIIARKDGRHRWNYLNSIPIQRVYDRWIRYYARPSVALLSRLKEDLEVPDRADAPIPDRETGQKRART